MTNGTPKDDAAARELLRAAGACVLRVDPEDRVRACAGLPGDGDREAVGRDARQALAPLVFEGRCLAAAMAEARRTGRPVGLVAVRPGEDGGEERWEARIRPVDGEPGELLLHFAPALDERADRQPYRQFSEDVLRSLGSGLAVVDDAGSVLVANEPAARILETTRDALREGGLRAILGDELAADVLAGKFDGNVGGPFDVPRRLAGGREIHVGFSLSPLSDRAGKRCGRILHFKDVTEIKRLKQQVVHQEKMAAIGSLAGGVAHEFNNLIGGMLGYAQLARATREPRDFEKCIEVVHESSMRAKDIVTSLLTFARRPEGMLEQVRLGDLIDQTLVLVERTIEKKGIRIARQYEVDGPAFVDSSRLQVVLLNLLTNARDAMDAGGTLTVRAFAEGDRLYLAVSDTGAGIAPENLYRVFEPFFTTKGAMGGSAIPGHGLGLSVCYGLVQGMMGEIGVESTVGAGSRFTVALPLIEAPDARPEESAPRVADRCVARRALVLDPDPLAADGLSRILRRLGLDVAVADGWARALDVSEYGSVDYVFQVPTGEESEHDLRCRRAFEIENPEARHVPCVPDGGTNGGVRLKRPYSFQDVVRVLTLLGASEAPAETFQTAIQ